jgi:hypothetical protein
VPRGAIREQHPDLGQSPVETSPIGRPADGLGTVPERLGFVGIVQQQCIAEVAQRPARDRMDLRLVAE